jgi:hypothetical protein
MSRVPTPGYLAEVEASHLLTQALPGAIVLHLKREMESETRPERRMFIELSLGEAVRHWQDVGELIRKAGALERQAPRGTAAGDA